MNKKQKLTPKYWVGHNIKDDDVYISTARKGFRESFKAMTALLGIGWIDDPDYNIILISINPIGDQYATPPSKY